MNAITGIYKITNPKGKIYIGQSVNCNDRRNQYKRADCEQQRKIYNSIKKYGWEAHRWEIIHVCAEHELNDLEVYYIELFQTYTGEHGLNLRSGGQKGSKHKHTETTKAKMSRTRIGNKNSVGRVQSLETRDKIRLGLIEKSKHKGVHKLQNKKPSGVYTFWRASIKFNGKTYSKAFPYTNEGLELAKKWYVYKQKSLYG